METAFETHVRRMTSHLSARSCNNPAARLNPSSPPSCAQASASHSMAKGTGFSLDSEGFR